MTRRIRTLRGRVLVKHRPPPDRTESGLYIPATTQERPQWGQLEAVSAGSDLTPGSLVVFPKFSDKRVWLDGELYELTHEKNLLLELTDQPKERKA